MKLNKINSYKSKLLKLKLIKTKIYKKNHNNFIKIEDISSRLKKVLHIIYNYHINNKRIIFIGVPIGIISKLSMLLKKTSHTVLPNSVWVSGLLTNQKACLKYLKNNPKFIGNKTSEVLMQWLTKSDLIVVLDFFSNQDTINEAYLVKIPIIALNCELDILNAVFTYKIPGNFKFTNKKVGDIFFYSLLSRFGFRYYSYFIP